MKPRARIQRAQLALTLTLAMIASVLLGISSASAQGTQFTAEFVQFSNGLSGPRPASVGTVILTDQDLVRGNNANEAVRLPGASFNIFVPGSNDGEFLVRVTFDDGQTVSNVLSLYDRATSNFGGSTRRYLLDTSALGGRTLANVTAIEDQRRQSHNLNWDDLGFTESPAPRDNNRALALDNSYVVRSGETLSVSVADGLDSNNSDPDGDTLTYTLSDRHSRSPNGTLDLNPDGSFTFQSNAGFAGSVREVITVSDGFAGPTLTQAVQFIVQPSSPTNNAAPVANDDNYVAIAGQLNRSEYRFLASWLGTNDVYAQPDILSYELVSATPGLDVVIEAFGRIAITPDASLSGPASFVYRVSDGFQSDTATGFVNVQGC